MSDKTSEQAIKQAKKTSEENTMEKITTEMAEYICDKLCKEPLKAKSQEELEEVCIECQLGSFICGILNEYNKINDFEKSQCLKLLKEIARFRKCFEEIVERLEEEQKKCYEKSIVERDENHTIAREDCINIINGIEKAIEIVKEVGGMNEKRRSN